MWRNALLSAVVILIPAWLAGCGGGDKATPPANQVGAARGIVDLYGASPESFSLLLNGAPLAVTLGPDGSYELPSLPPGTHTLEIIASDGMRGGRVSFQVDPGEITQVEPIKLQVGGQIAGIVQKCENGVFTPLAGVEVVARSDLIWIMADNGRATVAPAKAASPAPLIYPPPDGYEEHVYTAITEEDGFYRMKAVAPGSYLVTVAVPGLTSGQQFVWVNAGEVSAANFSLEPLVEAGVGTVTGTVYGLDSDGGKKPLVGAVVEITLGKDWSVPVPLEEVTVSPSVKFQGVSPPGCDDNCPDIGIPILPPEIIWRTFTTLTDARGQYSLNVPSGACRVTAWALGYEWQSRSLMVQANTTHTVDFDLALGPPIIPFRGR